VNKANDILRMTVRTALMRLINCAFTGISP
jgi:hypothetical protein